MCARPRMGGLGRGDGPTPRHVCSCHAHAHTHKRTSANICTASFILFDHSIYPHIQEFAWVRRVDHILQSSNIKIVSVQFCVDLAKIPMQISTNVSIFSFFLTGKGILRTHSYCFGCVKGARACVWARAPCSAHRHDMFAVYLCVCEKNSIARLSLKCLEGNSHFI